MDDISEASACCDFESIYESNETEKLYYASVNSKNNDQYEDVI